MWQWPRQTQPPYKETDRIDLIVMPACWECQELAARCCQTNANQSQFSGNLNLVGCAETAPLGQSSGAVQLEI